MSLPKWRRACYLHQPEHSYVFDSDGARYVGSGELGHVESDDDTAVENQWENEKMQRRHHVMERLLYFRFHLGQERRWIEQAIDLCDKSGFSLRRKNYFKDYRAWRNASNVV